MPSKIKVLQVIPKLGYGGAETGCYDLAHYLPENNCSSYIVTSGGELLKYVNKKKVTVIKLPVHSKNPILMLFNTIILIFIILFYNISIIHARSIAEDVIIYDNNKNRFTGKMNIIDGKIQDDLIVEGKSLVHSAPLTAMAFDKGFLGNYGNYIVSIGLLLFAFSTAIAWSYYGDRAMTYLFGSGSVVYYRIVYVIGFFIASFADTTVIWNVSLITIALMTIPNLIGLLWLRQEVKSTVKDYWINFKKEWPNENTPE